MQKNCTRTRGKNKTALASGSLSFVSAGKCRDGSPKAKRWLYSYTIKSYERWINIKIHVPDKLKSIVKEAIDAKKGFKYILENILEKPLQTTELINAQDSIESGDYFKPKSFADARKRIFRAIVQRQGQRKFRTHLLEVYNRRCVITGFDAEKALEAAHIHPYKGDNTNEIWNGLLLRADIHTLFDFHLIAINPETNQVCIAPELKNTEYGELDGKPVELPNMKESSYRKEMLELHYKEMLRLHYEECDCNRPIGKPV